MKRKRSPTRATHTHRIQTSKLLATPAVPAIATAKPCPDATLATARQDAAMAVDAPPSETTASHGILAGSVVKEAAPAPRTLTAEESTTHENLRAPSLQYGVVPLTEHLVVPLLQLGDGPLDRLLATQIVGLEGDDPRERLWPPVAIVHEPAEHLAICALAIDLQNVDRPNLVAQGELLEGPHGHPLMRHHLREVDAFLGEPIFQLRV